MPFSLKILVIDDDEDDFFITSHLLSKIEDLTITTAWCNNAEDAFVLLKDNTYDINFVDYRLGARTGIEIISEAIAAGANKPIILLTGMGSKETDKLAVSIGAYDYLKKDELSTEKLERCIRYSLERFKSFQTLQNSQKKYRSIFENAFSFVFICDTNLNFIECNKGGETVVGYNTEDIVQLKLTDILPESEIKELERATQAKLPVSNQAVRFNTANKELKKGYLSLSYFEPEDAAPYWQGLLQDDTWRQQAIQNNLQLEKLHATHRLVRTLAHEIRNPLTNLTLAIDGLKDSLLQDEQLEYLEILQRSCGKINTILSELLHSSKEIDLVKTPVDLREILLSSIEQTKDRAVLKQISVELTLPEIPCDTVIDSERFLIAVNNIIINAIEAVSENTGKLSVSLNQLPGTHEIIIMDNGSGITETQMTSLFEPYFTTKRSGMGLGLVSALNIVQAHKGEIKVASVPEKHTSFTIVLPV